MMTTVKIPGKEVQVEWSNAAEKGLNKREQPLLVEMELVFGCLIRKAVSFPQQANPENFVFVSPQLKVRFRPMMSNACSLSGVSDGGAAAQDFPFKNPAAFVPKQLSIDFKHGQWSGKFQIAKAKNN